MLLLLSAALGLASSLFPPVNVEAYLVGVAAARDGVALWAAVLAVTAGHMAGKLLFYALGRGWLLRGLTARLVRRSHLAPAEEAVAVAALPLQPPAAAPVPRRRWRRWADRFGLDRVEAAAGRPWATAGLCLLSAVVGLPPFAVAAVLLGRLRMPVGAFLLVGGAGRLLRFAAVAGAGGLVLG